MSVAASLDGGLDAGVASLPAICHVAVEEASHIAELTCIVPLAQPGTSGPIYESILTQGGGVVPSMAQCDANPLAWYPDDPITPTRLSACGPACLRAGSLFPSFVAAVKPFSGCEDASSPRLLCDLPEDQYQDVSEIFCSIAITQAVGKEAVYESIRRRDANVVSSRDLCASDPLAWYPDDPAAPTKVTACEAACALSTSLFPSLVASTMQFFSCDTAD